MALNKRRDITGAPKVYFRVEARLFARAVDRHVRTLLTKKGSAKAIQAIAYHLMKSIVRKTPVWSGKAQAGWFKAARRIAREFGTRWPYRLIPRTGKYGLTIAKSRQRIHEGFRLGSAKFHLRGKFKWIEIINKVPYIMALEHGFSTKAPYGMVRVSMALMRRRLANAMKKQLYIMWEEERVPRWTDFRAGGAVEWRPGKETEESPVLDSGPAPSISGIVSMYT